MRHLHAGQLVSAVRCCVKSQPQGREVQDALGGVLCRCTGYRKIIDAVVAQVHPRIWMARPALSAIASAASTARQGHGRRALRR